MEHLRRAFPILMILVAAPTLLTILPAAQGMAQAARDTSRLAEPGEKKANEVQPPELVMDILGVRPGMVIGEVGAGRGRMTVHLAARVGDTGKVYANDIDAAAVDYLKERCRRQGLTNVETVLSLPGDARFPPNSLDLVVMAYVYHHVDDPVPLLKSLLFGLKPWGIVAMAEPKPEHVELSARALTRESVGEDALAAGFALEAVIEDRLQADDIFVLRPIVPDAPESHDPQKVRALWLEYLAWAKTAQGGTAPRDYAMSLDADGVPGLEVRRRLHVLRGQFTEQPEGIEMIYDSQFGKSFTGRYLGQTPPGNTPVKFPFDFMPPGYKLHSAPVFTPDGKEVYFSAMDFSVRFSEKIFVMTMEDDGWTSPRVASFSGNFFDGSPSMSPDGRYLFFSSARTMNQDGMNESGERNLWYVERNGRDWGSPTALPFRTSGWENGSDLSALGHLFFDSSDIYKIKFPVDAPGSAEALGPAVNSGATELHPCVAPDERFLVFYSSREGHFGSGGGDLYISFKNRDGTWAPAENLGESFNKGHLSTSFPRLSPDGKYFFFLKLVSIPWQAEVYWVSVSALDDLKRSVNRR